MIIQKQIIHNVLVLQLEGEITMETFQEFVEFMNDVVKHKIPRILLNFSKIDYINSLGIRALMRIIMETQENNGHLAFCGLNQHLIDTFETISLDKVIKFFEEENDGIEYLKN